MATTLEKLSQQKSVKVTPVATDPRRLNWSKARALAEDEKQKKINAELEETRIRLEKLANEEEANLEKLGSEDNLGELEEIEKLKAEVEELKKEKLQEE